MPQRPNGSYISNSDALTAWTPIAREALLATAQRYHAVLSYAELATRVQSASAISTRQDPAEWVGKLLDRVAVDAERRGEPPIAALGVGDHDDDSAARDRLRCYRTYADDLPEDGGVPAVLRRTPERRAPRATRTPSPRTSPRQAPPSAPSLREVTCVNCFLIVPAGPTCSSCGEPLPAA